MSVQFFYPGEKQVVFQLIDRKKYRGTSIPGGATQQSEGPAVITVQQFSSRLFTICHYLFEIFSKIKLSIHESSGLRFEALLSGEMHIIVNGEKQKFRAGEYRITDVPLFKTLFRRHTSCGIFISHYSAELLEQLGIVLNPCAPQRMPDNMANLVNELLHNPYAEGLRNFYYENCVRELLFFHFVQNKSPYPGNLLNKDVAVIYKVDAILASDLRQHYTIGELSRMVNTNVQKLKTGFKKVYDMGVFERLIFRRMEEAKLLLSTTDKPISEIAGLAGYETVAGFIHAFLREFGVTPREWRIQEREGSDENWCRL
jgi:AraC-like DNA-binding protein